MTQSTATLQAKTRQETGKQVASLRLSGQVPAVLYGHKVDNINLSISESDLQKLLNKISESDLIDLSVDDGKVVKVLIHDISYEPVRHKINHVDFYQVNMKEKIKTHIELNFINESPAVKDLGGVLVKTLDTIEVECLPGDLISHLDVDLASLKKIGDILRVKDLKMPASLEILTDGETVVVLTEEQKKEEEKPATEATPAAEVPTEAETKAEKESEEK